VGFGESSFTDNFIKSKMKGNFLLIIFFSLFACNQNKDDNEQKDPGIDTTGKTQNIKQENTANPYTSVDISPMDMSYYPPEYPQKKIGDSISEPPLARIIYSRPHLQGRKLFHDLLKYGEPWRLGANEATELELFRDATIQGKKIKAGRYVLYCIPQPKEWTIKLNGNIDSWGLNPDASKDISNFVIPVKETKYNLEYFTIVFEKKGNNSDILLAWDNLEARLPISF
jgi:hypothetical protein